MSSTEPLPMAEREPMDSNIPHSSSTDDSTSLSTDEHIPSDKTRLTMLLVSGKRNVFDFDPSATVDTVKSYILDHWPQDWAEQLPPSVKNIEFVYLGKFLDNHSKLKDNGLLGGHATIVHLVIRQYIKKTDDDRKSLESISRCKCCTIL
ncbi:ubiquitin-related domain-containing protein [Halteromyces radiatus]|uniref:ubiquitin-related domain-containing protein n=1 Tax=Halteromyces radiatus TaxID=101107 RepID=UPI00221EA686|nr:ubiquitin-related domain-containing protein [Halteromyces radiatus]KAI8081707.1 ubiquitin-related domain-containing protein [Halteromyces radiatus]